MDYATAVRAFTDTGEAACDAAPASRSSGIARSGAPPVSDAPFRDPESAVRYAFERASFAIVTTSSVLKDLRGGTVPLPGEDRNLSPWDKAAKGALVFCFMERNLDTASLILLSARHTVPITGEDARRKRQHIARVLDVIRREMPEVPLSFMADVVRAWAGLKSEHDIEWWVEHLKVTERTLRYWKHGRRDRGRRRGIRSILAMMEAEAYDRLREPMMTAGLIPRDG